MRILLMNQFFWPEQAATSQLLTDVARGLADRGHQVSVICADSAYAGSAATGAVIEDPGKAGPGDIDPGKPDTAPPVQIHRVKGLAFARSSVGRLLSYGSYFAGSLVHGLTAERPDLILSLTTPPLLSLVGTLIHKLRGSRHFIWEMDVYPDVAVGLHYFKRGGLLERIIGALADWSRRDASGILALGPCMRDLLVRRGITGTKISIVENWADGSSFTPELLAQTANANERPLTILYSGNLGLAHDVDTILEAMRQLKDDRQFRFIFAGGGGRRKQLEEACRIEGLHSAEFRPYAQRSNLGGSLAEGDIGLVTQLPAALGSVVPSKVYGLMAAGRPILFIGPGKATPAQIISKFDCGWHVDCNDSAGLIGLLKRLRDNPDRVKEAGQRSRNAFLQHYDLPIGVSRVCEALGAGNAIQVDGKAVNVSEFEKDARTESLVTH